MSPTHVSAALASGLRVLEVCVPRLRVSLALRCVPKCRDTLCRETGSHYGRPEMLLLNPVEM